MPALFVSTPSIVFVGAAGVAIIPSYVEQAASVAMARAINSRRIDFPFA
jgi:hypothetical protein